MSAKARFWLAGISIALLGIVLARIVPGFLAAPTAKFAFFLGGVIVATAGMGVILMGMRR